uniref:WD repeat-containing protein 97 isoform X2 n=1 Tax=Scatophagus argus TaxID=75038 RepID=UPI001ED861B1|nr:WD repeat-containing protein 97 isoform X2 [Scatophagus argus]
MQGRSVQRLVEMVGPGEEMRTTTLVLSSPALSLGSQRTGTSNGRTLEKQNVSNQDVKQATSKVKTSKRKQHVFTHGLHRLQHFSCDSPVRFMMYSEAAAAFISLHSDNTVCLYSTDGHKQTFSAHLPFMGLTNTKISGCLVGWGPGPVFALLDSELRPLDAAHDALDIRVCQAAEHSTELVTAGVGNVCVWSVRLMTCKVKIQEGLQHSTFTQMALVPPRSDRPHRAFVVSGQLVTVVDVDAGKVLEHGRDLYSRDITAMLYCSHLDRLITASEHSIRIWGPDLELHVVFLGHSGVVNSLFYSPALSMLLSASVDCTIHCWNVEEGDVIECVHTEQNSPPLCIGGNRKGETFFSFSHQGVDFWSIRTLYTLHCKLKGDEGAPLRQILVSSFPAPFPTRVLCVCGDSDIMLVAGETGAVLASFKAKQRILCADYCLQKEILLALTETGTVLQANALTNPITLMQEWEGRGQGPWLQRDSVTESDGQKLPIPGPACCLVLYSYVAETQGALEEWMSLQERRGCSHRRNRAALDDAKNKFLIILGQSGGCVSVLKMDNGKVLYRAPAHYGQRVTTLQVYPENGYLLSTGEDMTVVVWRVNPYVQECLSQHLRLHYGQPHIFLAVLGPQLALTFHEPNSDTYNLMRFSLLNQSHIECPSKEGHLDHFTGLCVCPDLEVFVSSSLDGTLCIWNEKNHIIETLQLNAVPECLAYGGFGGKLFLGIKGDLYRMNCSEFLPHFYQQMLLYTYCAERVPDLPIVENEDQHSKRKNASPDKEEEDGLPAISSNLLLTEDTWRQKEFESLVTNDLTVLLQDSVKCRKGKPPSTKETKKEAFDRYMKIIYRLPPNIKIDLEDIFDPDKLSFYPAPYDDKPRNHPASKEDVCPEFNLDIPVAVDEKKLQKKKTPATNCKPKTLMKVKPWPVAIPKKPIIVERDQETSEIISPIKEPKPKTPIPPPRSPEILSPIKEPKPKTPIPPPCSPRTTAPLIQREPTPEEPAFLKQFTDAGWFKDLYPNKKCIPSSLSPEDFSLQLLDCLNTCSVPSKREILSALQALHSQGLLQNTDKLYQSLSEMMPKLVRPHMSHVERTVLIEMLNLLMHLKSAGRDLVTNLLTLLAFKKLGFRETVLHMLTALGVNEAERWLWPELESWDSELQDPFDIWKSLRDRADCWLELLNAKNMTGICTSGVQQSASLQTPVLWMC